MKQESPASAGGGRFNPLILILPRLLGLLGVEITQAAADFLSLAVSVPFAVTELRQMTVDGSFDEALD